MKSSTSSSLKQKSVEPELLVTVLALGLWTHKNIKYTLMEGRLSD